MEPEADVVELGRDRVEAAHEDEADVCHVSCTRTRPLDVYSLRTRDRLPTPIYLTGSRLTRPLGRSIRSTRTLIPSPSR